MPLKFFASSRGKPRLALLSDLTPFYYIENTTTNIQNINISINMFSFKKSNSLNNVISPLSLYVVLTIN
jgi:hypothetical protein